MHISFLHAHNLYNSQNHTAQNKESSKDLLSSCDLIWFSNYYKLHRVRFTSTTTHLMLIKTLKRVQILPIFTGFGSQVKNCLPLFNAIKLS
jgi:predicted HAD superfamily hydrolase